MAIDYFAGIGNQLLVFEKGAYLGEGTYTLQIEKTIIKETRNSGDGFIAEFRVVESSNPEHPVGSRRTWFQSLVKMDYARPAIQEFMLAVCGLEIGRDKARIEEDFLPQLANLLREATKDNTLAGQRVRCVVTEKPKKTGEGVFSKHTFSPAPVAEAA